MPHASAFFDTSAFPIVAMRYPDADAVFRWCREADALLAHDRAFVLLECGRPAVPASEPGLRAWLRLRRMRLNACCKGLMVVEPDISQRLTARARAELLFGHAGVRALVISREGLVGELAPILLSQSAAVASSDIRRQRTRRN
ncbi:hypothetical protein [Chitinasiproducens palmae]|uniref:Uncharacterized protein n=1 Tax=Chitinasiproducens palmae TaxID=1770053 RepID=A0A1H2PM52_9BURK|nr:hypothetical protein [Chitinasiproducens palmae]SDV47644.1 hypothetical protein SAMN05216551_103181 [Chitinasiproducens palmae]